MRIRNKLTILLKLFIIASTFGGVVLSLIQANQDGYSHWSRRLLYFTAQSNLWIGSVCLLLVLSTALRFQEIWLKRLYVLKFIFTVSITITGLVFCTLLAPFAPKSYNLWVFSGYLTHVVSPVLALCDFFIDDYPLQIQRPHLWLSIIPPLFYFTSTMIFSFLKVDFGRGEFYPYYFLNVRSPSGIFGFSNQAPFFIGCFYWTILFIFLIISIAWILAKLKNIFLKKKQKIQHNSRAECH